MIKMTRVDDIPAGLMENLSEISAVAREDFTKSFIGLSHTVYITEDDTPLFLVGAFQPHLLANYKEIWFLGTTFLKARHVRAVKPLFLEWLETQECRIIARCNNPSAHHFLRFFGFHVYDEVDMIALYEV